MSVSTPQRAVAMGPKTQSFPSWTEPGTSSQHAPAHAPQEKRKEGVDTPGVPVEYTQPMPRSQKVVPVKLNGEQIAALDLFVERAGLNGRSHALRVLAGPYISSIITATETKSAAKAWWALVKAQKEVNDLMKVANSNEAKTGQQTFTEQLDPLPA